jgi:outer membrane murein-binding lipoprotein Lpp
MSQKKIEALRGQISTLQAERDALQNQTWSRSEVAYKVRRMVDEWQDKSAEQNRLYLLWMAHGDHGHKLLTADTVGTEHAAMLGPAMVTMLGAEQVAARLLAGIDSVLEGLDTAERLSRIAAIAADLDRLETEEEALVCAAETQGAEVLRRPDARPEIVLAL